MDYQWMFTCLLLVVGACSVLGEKTAEQQAAVDRYEEALMEQLAKLKEMGKAGQDQDAMKKAMDSVAHLKPADLPIQDMIGMMGRVFQKQMGLNINVKDNDQLEREAEELKADKKAKKDKKKKAKKNKKGPSLSRSKKEEL